ncbi:hypothetical protein [Microbaculum marinisediminis]|uniref:Uncharacterized protein n=1 Tax=Microbaculum marinisediminis TaxID=2931392 RepID=A0AAW5R596_9HYPH|nr:hypothetical protein [Microbaculum sp. A6E488]MCT8973700.1 hypothetical protein [Microbaculum sp. A6E488]
MSAKATQKRKKRHWLEINRAPVLTLWAGVVAECLGFDPDEALTLGRAVAGLKAYSKGVSIGLFQPTPHEIKEKRRSLRKHEALTVDLLGRAVPVTQTDAGLRALGKDRPIKPDSVQRYLESKFGDALDDAREAMMGLALSMSGADLAEYAYRLYEDFRPDVPSGAKGWGAAGRLDLDKIRHMAD